MFKVWCNDDEYTFQFSSIVAKMNVLSKELLNDNLLRQFQEQSIYHRPQVEVEPYPEVLFE